MGQLPSDLAEVLQRFPDERDLISGLAAKNESFRSLCEDYAVARQALHCFRASHQAKEEALVADYRNLVIELECEIEAALAKAKAI